MRPLLRPSLFNAIVALKQIALKAISHVICCLTFTGGLTMPSHWTSSKAHRTLFDNFYGRIRPFHGLPADTLSTNSENLFKGLRCWKIASYEQEPVDGYYPKLTTLKFATHNLLARTYYRPITPIASQCSNGDRQ